MNIPKTKTKPWAHQVTAYNLADKLPGCMLALDMGTGKSKVVVDIINNRLPQRTLIVCPKSVGPAWLKQFKLHAASHKTLPLLLKGSVKQKTKQAQEFLAEPLPNFQRIIIINYESAWRPPFKDYALAQSWGLIVADEIHRIKAPGSKVSWFFNGLGKHTTAKKIGLTGTPMPHSPLDIYAQYRFLAPHIFGTSFNRFKNQYCVMGGYGGYEVRSFKNTEDMHNKIYSIAYRVTKDEVLDLPPVMHVEKYCELGSTARGIYKELKSDFIADLEQGMITASTALVRLLRFQQLTGGWVKNDEGVELQVDVAKITAFKELLQDLPFEPLVVFARFSKDLETIKAAAAEHGYTCAELSGNENTLQEWQDGNYDLIAVQIKSGGVGVDLTRARYCVYYSLGFSLGDYEQSLSRPHRPGQTRNVTYFHFICQDTVDEQVYESLKNKKNVVTGIIQQMKGEN
jgi:SNF2 family DNA or RNA helicase